MIQLGLDETNDNVKVNLENSQYIEPDFKFHLNARREIPAEHTQRFRDGGRRRVVIIVHGWIDSYPREKYQIFGKRSYNNSIISMLFRVLLLILKVFDIPPPALAWMEVVATGNF